MSEAATRTPRGATRVAALDGLRGVAIILVMLGHGTAMLWTGTAILDVPYLRGFVLGGTVTVFFIVGGYVVTRGLLRELDQGVCDPLRFYARRLVRLGPQLVLVCAAVLLVSWLRPEAAWSVEDARDSVLHVLTYTWNIFLEDDTLSARGDLGHLWYLSVQQQVYILLPLFLALFSRTRALAILVLLAGIVVSVALRFVWVPDIGYWPVSLRVVTRWDGLLLGVLLAVLLPLVSRSSRLARVVPAVFVASVVAFLVLILLAGESGPLAYLRWWGVGVLAVSGLVVGTIVLHPGGRSLRLLTAAPLTVLGRASLSLYIWHYPVFWFMRANTGDWYWYSRTFAALLVLAPIVIAMERYVEPPTRRFLADHAFFRVRPGQSAGAEKVAL